MAVPKQKTSKARRNKRRANHRAALPRTSACPQCKSPRLPHRVCPVCGTYNGREVVEPAKKKQAAETTSESTEDES